MYDTAPRVSTQHLGAGMPAIPSQDLETDKEVGPESRQPIEADTMCLNTG